MGTRRLRLYVVAYLRGLLTPYYVQGNLSVVREEMVLNALSSEMDAEASKQVHLIQASLAQNVKDKQGFYDKLFNKILDFRYKLEFQESYIDDDYENERWTDDPTMNRMIARYKRLQDSGEWEELVELSEQHHEELSKKTKKIAANPYLNADPENSSLQWSFGSTEEERKQAEKDRLNEEHGIE